MTEPRPTTPDPEAERYRALLHAIDIGFCIIRVEFDGTGRPVDYVFVEVNPAFEAQTGLAAMVGKSMRALRPDLEQYWVDAYGRIARTGTPEHFEHEAAALGRWFGVHAFRVGAPEANEVAVLFEDIGPRKRVEQALRDSEGRQAVLLRLSDALRTIDDPGEIRRVAMRMLGEQLALARIYYFDVERDGEDWVDDYILDEDRPQVFAAIGEAIRAKSLFELEHRVLLADGGVGWVLSRAVPLLGPDGEIAEWFGVGSDVTDRHIAAEKLGETEARLTQFGEASQDVLWIRDAATLQWTYLTPAFETIYGLTREEATSGDDLPVLARPDPPRGPRPRAREDRRGPRRRSGHVRISDPSAIGRHGALASQQRLPHPRSGRAGRADRRRRHRHHRAQGCPAPPADAARRIAAPGPQHARRAPFHRPADGQEQRLGGRDVGPSRWPDRGFRPGPGGGDPQPVGPSQCRQIWRALGRGRADRGSLDARRRPLRAGLAGDGGRRPRRGARARGLRLRAAAPVIPYELAAETRLDFTPGGLAFTLAMSAAGNLLEA